MKIEIFIGRDFCGQPVVQGSTKINGVDYHLQIDWSPTTRVELDIQAIVYKILRVYAQKTGKKERDLYD